MRARTTSRSATGARPAPSTRAGTRGSRAGTTTRASARRTSVGAAGSAGKAAGRKAAAAGRKVAAAVSRSATRRPGAKTTSRRPTGAGPVGRRDRRAPGLPAGRSRPLADRGAPPRVPRLSRPGSPRARALGLLVGLIVLFAVVVVRLVYVQVLGADRYVAYGEEQRIEPIEVAGGRGAIYDRNGNDLAISIPRTTVAADPSIVADPAAAARRLAPVLGLDRAELAHDLADEGRFVYLARQVDDEVAEKVAELGIDGVITFDEQARFNPSNDLARALIGGVDIDNGGLSGIEASYDDQLSGESGRFIVERDLQGRTIPAGRHQIEPAEPGDDLILTIDRNLQSEVEMIVARQVEATGAKGGIAIVSDPATGEVLALANVATDPATGGVGNSTKNTAVTDNYEPGSVNKVITLAAALEEGLVTPDQVVDVPPSIRVADHTYPDSHPGRMTITDVLAKSSNVGTIQLAQRLGEERLHEYLVRFGFGQPTGLGLPHEVHGAVPPTEDWSGTSIGSIPLGQGISVTAMQMLFAYNVVANDGVYVPPTLVTGTRDAEGERHEVAPGERRRVVSPTTASQLRAMLTEVIANGTGRAAAIDGYEAGGKTGTARKPQPEGGYRNAEGGYDYISTFAGFLPAGDPRLSIIVVIDEPTTSPYAAQVAAPAFRDIGRYAARTMGVAPEPAAPRAPLAIRADEGRVRAQPAQAPNTAPATTVPPTTAPSSTTPGPTTVAAGGAPTAPTTPRPAAAGGGRTTGAPGG
jgi:cell division protein FtsI (penicillin-binding protein 3)